MQKFGVLGKFINSNGKDGNSDEVHGINDYHSCQNVKKGKIYFSEKCQNKGRKKNHYTYGITTFYDACKISLVYYEFHRKLGLMRNNFGMVAKTSYQAFTLAGYEMRDIIGIIKRRAKQL